MENVDKHKLVDLLPLPRLVEFAEKQEFDSEAVREYLAHAFSSYDFSEYSSLVLGCTHFNYFKDVMRSLLPEHVKFVDGNEGTVKELIRRLSAKARTEVGAAGVEYYYSGRRVEDKGELERIELYLRRLDDMYDIE